MFQMKIKPVPIMGDRRFFLKAVDAGYFILGINFENGALERRSQFQAPR